MKIAIIGGGFTGLTAAYRLGQKGHKVTVFEKSENLGGLAGGFKINESNLEKAYHHIFRTDKEIIGLAKELGLESKLKWHESSIGLYYEGKMYPFTTPKDMLLFGGMGLIDRIRFGLAGLYLQKDNNWQKYVKQKAVNWMEKMCGEKAYKVIWEPLLKGKFHDYYKEVSMAWMWARIHTRGNSKAKGENKEHLGYFDGGFQIIIDELAKRIKKNGGEIILKADIKNIDDLLKDFDKVVACVPSGAFGRLVDPKRYAEYINKLDSIEYLGAVVVVFTAKQSLSKYYWHNINDTKSPFLAFIQHTNLIDKKNYGNENVYYLGTYVPHDHKFFNVDEKEVVSEFFDYLKKIFPDFDEKEITSKFIFRLKNAQHIVTIDYPDKIPAYETPIKNVYLANFSQIFPEDRGTNFAVKEGNKIAEIIQK